MLTSLKRRKRGQGLVEFTIMAPILLVILSGLFEFGFLLNEYIDVLDGAREAARFAADNNPFNDDYSDRLDYYLTVSDLAIQTSQPVELCIDADPLDGLRCGDDAADIVNGDVVISVFGIAKPGPIVTRFPNPPVASTPGEYSRFGNETSNFTSGDVAALVEATSPNTGVVIVEVTYYYDQKFSLPWITAFIPDPIIVETHTIMPVVAAEPTPTPIP